jgi:hypothetical protein
VSKLSAFRRLVNAEIRLVTEGYPAPPEFFDAQNELNGAFTRSMWPALRRCTEQRLRALGYTCTAADAKALAIRHIRYSVERGDSIRDIVAGGCGSWSAREGVNVGGTRCDVHDKMHGGRIVHVTRVNGIGCCYEFSLDRLIKEIQEPVEARQMSLFK